MRLSRPVIGPCRISAIALHQLNGLSLLIAVRVIKNEFHFHGNLRMTLEGYSFALFCFETNWNVRLGIRMTQLFIPSKK